MKKHIKTYVIIIVMIIGLAGIITHVILSKPQTDEVSAPEAGQTLMYVKLTSVIGNEIAYVIVEERGEAGYQETQQEGQLQIPVGTEVITKLGTSTTFSRLAGGDILKLLMQETQVGEKEILKIWIMQ